MIYWDEMQGKYGFSDGDAIPAGIDLYREVYIKTVNTIAQRRQSQVRAVAYNRPGLHNCCLIYFAPLAATTACTAQQLADGSCPDLDPEETTGPDQAMEEAIEEARNSYIDEYVDVTIALNPGFQEFLEGLVTAPCPEAREEADSVTEPRRPG